jgi:hypothetical protein
MRLTMPAMVYRRKMGIPGQLRIKYFLHTCHIVLLGGGLGCSEDA